MRSRQSIRVNPDSKELTPRQENALIKTSKDRIPELIGIPITSFEAPPTDMVSADLIKNVGSTRDLFVKNVFNSTNALVKGVNNDAAELFDIPKGVLMDMQVSELEDPPLIKKKNGIFGVGLLAPRTNIPHEYITTTVSPRNIPIISKISTSNYFFITYDNPNNARVTLSGILKSFAVIKTLSQCTVKDCSEMLKLHYTNVIAISESDYTTGYFEHPKYCDDSGYPLQVRYAEIPIIKQKTPGRLDNIPLGYPDFDTTPDGVTTRKGPVPAPPYPNFVSGTGATFNLTTATGATISFIDKSVRSPWQFAPTGWNWVFGPSASPTGSTAQNPNVRYNYTGNYTVVLTASNASGSSTKTKINFVTVTV